MPTLFSKYIHTFYLCTIAYICSLIATGLTHTSKFQVLRSFKSTKNKRSNSSQLMSTTLSLCIVLILGLVCGNCVEAYKNLTVGDSLGWYDNQVKPDVDYQKWAAANNFSLGDFLIFNTDTNHSVVQTNNATIYKLCDYNNAMDNDTIQWSQSDPSNTATHDVSVPVPLLKEGVTYFFSGDYDGDQCRNGQHFMITITHGQGLPKSTDDSAAGPAGSPQSGNGDDETIPETIVPNSDFSHPKQEDDSNDGTETSGSVSLMVHHVHGKLVLLGFVYLLCS